MLIVIALGGHALLRRREPMTAEHQRASVRLAALAIAPVAAEHQIVITHGNGPQTGLLSLQGAAYEKVKSYSLDVLGAQAEGTMGYMIEQELGSLLPFERPFATMLTMVQVDPHDPAFRKPTKFIGPIYGKAASERLAREKNWTFKPDGDAWRRVVPSPEPKRIFELQSIRWLLEHGTIVIAAGGGGIPTMDEGDHTRRLIGVECVVDTDLASELLARELGADLFVMLTDAAAVYVDWGRPEQRAIRHAAPSALDDLSFSAGSMGPKVEAACRFARATGKQAAIGSLADFGRIVDGTAGTTISASHDGIVYENSEMAGMSRRESYLTRTMLGRILA
jgi:carbamate kinase